jgi:uncharacterized glyoxalase superfamily metalloenzyme YdcJ
MRTAGLPPKDSIEGPPRRAVPILLRQTSFLALDEPIRFAGESRDDTHTARFGEVEQRGCALTRKGRGLYDRLLDEARARSGAAGSAPDALNSTFKAFPDDAATLFREGLAFFRFQVDEARLARGAPPEAATAHEMVAGGWLQLEPMTYEDFLPVSAAGIFRSNLGAQASGGYAAQGNQAEFEKALGAPVSDEIALYEAAQSASLAACERVLRAGKTACST